MHSGFAALRQAMPLNVAARLPAAEFSDAVRQDISRILDLWQDARAQFGQGGPFLFGAFTIADAFYAPVVSRFTTYGVSVTGDARAYMDAVLAHPPCRNGSATRRPKRPRDRNRGALRRLAARQRAAGPHQTGARSIAQAVAHEGAQQSHRRRLGAAGQCHQRELRMAVQRRIQHQLDQLPDRMPSRAAATMPRNTASDARTVSSRLPISSQRRRTAVLGSAAMP